jgi:hypothetical protein
MVRVEKHLAPSVIPSNAKDLSVVAGQSARSTEIDFGHNRAALK